MHISATELRQLGATLNPPADPALLDRLELNYGIRFPSEARALYEEANGTASEFGDSSWRFWPADIEELTLVPYFKQSKDYVVRPEKRSIDPSKYVRFFDYLIDLPLYAYCADSRSDYFGEVIGCTTDGGTFDAFVAAPSIANFLRKFIASRGDDPIIIDDPKCPTRR